MLRQALRQARTGRLMLKDTPVDANHAAEGKAAPGEEKAEGLTGEGTEMKERESPLGRNQRTADRRFFITVKSLFEDKKRRGVANVCKEIELALQKAG